MSGSTVYSVVLQLHTSGALVSQLGTVGTAAGAAHGALERARESGARFADGMAMAGERIGSVLEGVADHIIDVGMGLAKWGGLAAVGAATYGVAGLNNELEQTQISLAAIAQAQGFAGTFNQGMELASDQLAKMKQDVKTLPGDLGQLSNIMKMVATPAAQGGANLDQIRKLAGRTMLTAGILGVQQDIAAREMAGLLAGRAGSHNILGGRLGLLGEEAKKFNAASPEERLARINREMDKYQGAADRFGQSFIANWTTLKDNIKYVLLSPVTAPLFDHVKVTLAEINTYFDEHKAKIEEITHTVGARLAQGWERAVEEAKKLAPVVDHLVDKIAHMNPGEMEKKLEHGAEAALALKLAGMAAPGLFRGAGSLIGGVMAMGGGGASVGGTAAAGGAVAALANPVGLLATGMALTGLAATATLAGSAVLVLSDKTSYYHDTAVKAAESLQSDLSTTWDHLSADAAPAIDHLKIFSEWVGVHFVEALDIGVQSINQWIGVAEGAWARLRGLPLWDLTDAAGHAALEVFRHSKDVAEPIKEHEFGLSHLLRLAPGEKLGSTQDKGAPKGPTGGGNTYINNVNINVTSNADPSRVARLVDERVRTLQRNPKSSSHVPTWDHG